MLIPLFQGPYFATYVKELTLKIGGQTVNPTPPPGPPAQGTPPAHPLDSWSHTVRFSSVHFNNGSVNIEAKAKLVFYRTVPPQDPMVIGGTVDVQEREVEVTVKGEIYNNAVIWRTLTAADLEIDETPDTNSYISVSENGAEQAVNALAGQKYVNLRGTILRSKYEICGQSGNQIVADVPNDLYNATLLFALPMELQMKGGFTIRANSLIRVQLQSDPIRNFEPR